MAFYQIKKKKKWKERRKDEKKGSKLEDIISAPRMIFSQIKRNWRQNILYQIKRKIEKRMPEENPPKLEELIFVSKI